MGSTRRILLLGAGFSRNWGGWLASEFVGELSGRLTGRPHLDEMLRIEQNFEEVLEQRRTAARRERVQQQLEDVQYLERAILETFREMNMTFVGRDGLSFSKRPGRSLEKYMGAFDVIFSLNQDLLLELNYPDDESLNPRWRGYQFPGITIGQNWRDGDKRSRVDLTVTAADEFQLGPAQPIVKLHGSVHWRDQSKNQVLVLGTGKKNEIERSGLLQRYFEHFEQQLCGGDVQIMVIGYSFSDPHINAALLKGEKHGLKMYLVNPAGFDAFRAHKGKTGHDRNELLTIPLVGMSARPLTSTFGDAEDPSLASFERFLHP